LFDISNVLEIGSYEGRSTCYMIEKLKHKKNCKMYCIDTWEGSMEHKNHNMQSVEQRFDSNVRIALGENINSLEVKKLKMYSIQAVSYLLTSNLYGFFDFVYVDGSHTSADVLSDAVNAYYLLKPGGLMVFDDYLWNYGFVKTGNPLQCPKIGVDSFINAFHGKVEVLLGFPSYQLYVKKL